MNIKKIRVLVVDDSVMFRETMSRGLSKDPNIEVVGAAADAYAARDKLLDLQPDVMTLDVEMPRLNGVEFVKQLLPQYPLPVVMVSSLSNTVFDALKAGAVDFVAKPGGPLDIGMDTFINELIIKVKIASTVKVGKLKKEFSSKSDIPSTGTGSVRKDVILAIGASTGGTEAIISVIKNLPREIPGVVIVQHMPPVFTKIYAERLNNICKLEVKEAQDGDRIRPGLALLAPGGLQMKVKHDRNGYFVSCQSGEKVNGHAPSVDVLFNSVAAEAGGSSVGIILTGMGSDGAKGLLEMREKGAYTIGQDEKTAVVYGMPMVAYNIGAVTKQCPIDSIESELMLHLKKMKYI